MATIRHGQAVQPPRKRRKRPATTTDRILCRLIDWSIASWGALARVVLLVSVPAVLLLGTARALDSKVDIGPVHIAPSMDSGCRPGGLQG